MLWLEGLIKRFGTTVAVRDISLDIAPGRPYSRQQLGRSELHSYHDPRHSDGHRSDLESNPVAFHVRQALSGSETPLRRGELAHGAHAYRPWKISAI